MSSISETSKKYLLDLARRSIKAELDDKTLDYKEIPDDVKEDRGVFVTLEISGNLRGCIGNIEPRGSTYKAVARNAVEAAFRDPRFPAVNRDEIDKIDIEVSILSVPRDLEYSDADDLKNKLKKKKPGVILEVGFFRATYLPQVWEDISDPEEFLSGLSMKAGLPPNYWRDGEDLSVRTYEVIKFNEGEFA